MPVVRYTHGKRGLLPDISEYSWQKRRDYLTLVAAVAASDNKLHKSELALLEDWLGAFKLKDKSRDAVMAVARGKVKLDQPAVERRLAGTNLVYSLLLDLMGMAMADGVLMDKEIALLRRIAAHLKVDALAFDILIEFVHAVYQSAGMDSPEPLYEYSIESAFSLLQKNGVKLFRHTLLCVASPECDENLKQRWYEFIKKKKKR